MSQSTQPETNYPLAYSHEEIKRKDAPLRYKHVSHLTKSRPGCPCLICAGEEWPFPLRWIGLGGNVHERSLLDKVMKI